MEENSPKDYERVTEENFRSVSELFFITTNILSEIIDAKDPYTEGHSERVRLLSVAIGREMELSEKDIAALSLAAKLHDIGKVKIDDSILKKTSGLTPEERSEIERHSIYSEDLLGRHPVIEPVIEAIRSHHEFLDGAGYPDKLTGESIPLLAKIISVADVFDAMTSNRVYREDSFSDRKALDFIREGIGSKFDAEVTADLERLYGNGTVDYCRGNYYFSKNPSKALEYFKSSLSRYSGDDVDKIYLMIGLAENVLWNPEEAINTLRKGAEVKGDYYHRIKCEIAFSEYYMGRIEALHENFRSSLKNSDNIPTLDMMHSYFGALLYFWKTRELEKAIDIVESLDRMFHEIDMERSILSSEDLLTAIEKKREVFHDKLMLQAKGYNIMGAIMYDLGEYEQAVKYYNNSISIKSIRGDLTGRAISLLGSARALLRTGRIHEAELRAMNSYRTNIEKEDLYGEYLSSLLLTEIFLETGNLKRALSWLQNSEKLRNHSKKWHDKNQYYMVKWLYDLETGNNPDIEAEIERKLMENNLCDFITAGYRFCLGRACESRDPDKARENFETALEIYKRIKKIPFISLVEDRMEAINSRS